MLGGYALGELGSKGAYHPRAYGVGGWGTRNIGELSGTQVAENVLSSVPLP